METGNTAVIRTLHCILFAFACTAIVSCSSTKPASEPQPLARPIPTNRTLLDANWKFHLGDITPSEPAIAAAYNDADWKPIDVPHDYILDGVYDKSHDRGHGYLPYDVGWYRKHFVIPATNRGKILRLDFDGVFRDSQVWLNGQFLGRHQSGYTPFSFDVTKIANVGGDNTLVVRVDPRQFEGWWNEGAGIYRHVYLTALSPLHVAQYGTQVVSTVPDGDKGASEKADIVVKTTLENSDASNSNCRVISEIVGPDGRTVTTMQSSDSAPAGAQKEVEQKTSIDHPKLWSVESPNLYQLKTTVVQNGHATDTTTTPFGIRTLRFDPNAGFFLNGKRVQIYGCAAHQDFAGVGIAVPDSLEPWRVAQLKKLGANGWRTAHNPPNESVLDACDQQGMLVMDENRHFGDVYTTHSAKGTKATDLSDLATMIRRDRNHPSIIMWSMCNEEGLQGSPEGAAIFKAMMDKVHQYDTTRPITSAMNGGWLTPKNDGDVEDIIGVNYSTNRYDAIHKRHPEKMIYASECMNEKTARGEYADDPKAGMRSAYNLSEETWQAVANRPWMGGSYIWTGIDYKGEPNPYGWPDVSNNTGLLDTCGFPKDKAHYFETCFTTKPIVHILPDTWNWKSGDTVRVLTWTNASKVELLLNGKSLGIKDVPQYAHAEWQVPFAPGELRANAYTNGKLVATDILQTTTAPAHVELHVDRTALQHNAQDAVVVQVSIVDDKGRIVPNADKRITFHLTGDAKLLGVGNGNPADHDTDKADNRTTFHGHCIAVIQAGADSGAFKLTATSPGLSDARISFHVR